MQAITKVAGFANVLLAPCRGLIPRVADHDVELAVFIDVADSHPLRAEPALDDGFFPGDRPVGLGRLDGKAAVSSVNTPNANVVKIRIA